MVTRKSVAVTLLTLIYLGSLTYYLSFDGIINATAQMSKGDIVIALGFVALAHCFAFLRSGSVLTVLGYPTDWRSLFLAFSAGNITNLSLNVFGQSVSRALVLSNAGVPFSASVLGTYIERILAAGILFIFSLIALWCLFHQIALDYSNGAGAIISTMAAITITMVVVIASLYRRQIPLHAIQSAQWIRRLWSPIGLTVCAHAMGLSAYLTLLFSIEPASISWTLIAAVTIVMFVTSLPISFAGFGLRELSAVSTLALIGVKPEVSFAVALLIGLLYISVTGLLSLIALMIVIRERIGAGAPKPLTAPGTKLFENTRVDNEVIKVLAIACAVLMFFRVRTQVTNSDVLVNINVADVVVCVAFSVVVLMAGVGRLTALFPRLITIALALLTTAIMSGLLVSYARSNLGNWAIYTRGVGWLLMLGYASLGAAYAKISREMGQDLIIKAMILAVVTICILQLGMLAVSQFYPLPDYVLSLPLQGYANNENAFCFELANAMLLIIIARLRGLFGRNLMLCYLAITVLAITAYFTSSRTGAIFIVLLLLFDATLWIFASGPKLVRWRKHAALAISSLVIVFGVALFAHPPAFMKQSPMVASPNISAKNTQHAIRALSDRFLQPQQSDNERWGTIVAGLRYWSENPLLGAGIGANYEQMKREAPRAQGIHSVFVAFLGETGTLGFAALLLAAALIAAHAWKKTQDTADKSWGIMLFGALMLMAVGGIVQDFFYQRVFWFVLGLGSAEGMNEKSDLLIDRIYLATVILFGLVVFGITLK